MSCVVSRTIAPGVAHRAQPLAQRLPRRLVEPGERLVEQQQPRLVDQRALEREALPHAAREPGHGVVAPLGQAGAIQRGVDAALDVVEGVDLREEAQVLGGGELGIQIEVVASRPIRARSARAALPRRPTSP